MSKKAKHSNVEGLEAELSSALATARAEAARAAALVEAAAALLEAAAAWAAPCAQQLADVVKVLREIEGGKRNEQA